MSHQVTAIKFRPQTFDELIGQDFVVSTLTNSINNNRIANAYLLSGPRGVGKTSAARIIAKALNCINGPTHTPCNECDNCVSITNGSNTDVIEIDGASNTGIEAVRMIQEEIMYPPVNSKYKVYIIDEVHMLSKSAFNALLKTIEEPPSNVVFIFATTEINKVIPTIRSRCQQFNFRLIPINLIFESLTKVLKYNNIKYENSALTWIASEGQGSMRDAYTLLDQIVSFCDNEVTLKKIQDKLGLVGDEKLLQFINSLITKNRETLLTEYFSLLDAGVSPEQILIELLEFFRNLLIIKANAGNNRFIELNKNLYNENFVSFFSFEDIENIIEILFKSYENIKFAINIQTEIEICLMKLLKYNEFIRPREIINKLEEISKFILNQNAGTLNESFSSNQNIKKNINPLTSYSQKKQNVEQTHNITMSSNKSEILKIIKSKLSSSHFQLATALSNIAFIEEKDNIMLISFTQKMHYDIAKKFEEFLNQEAIKIIGEKHNNKFKIKVEFSQNNNEKKIEEKNKENIINLFQGQEI